MNFYNPFRKPKIPEWPGGVFSDAHERTMEQLARREGCCTAMLGMAYLAAASGCMSKGSRTDAYFHIRLRAEQERQARRSPDSPPLRVEDYQLQTMWDRESNWRQRPALWIMLIAGSGLRKTQAQRHAFRVQRAQRSQIQMQHAHDTARWNSHEKSIQKQPHIAAEKPSDKPLVYFIENTSIPRLHEACSQHNKGVTCVYDEIARMFGGFGQYGGKREHADAPDRADTLLLWDGDDHAVNRKLGDTYARVTAATIYGATQPKRIKDFHDLDKDGLGPRFLPHFVTRGPVADPTVEVEGLRELEEALQRLLDIGNIEYTIDYEGALLVREMETYGSALASMEELGEGWVGAMGKMHGQMVRIATVLHGMRDPTNPTIPLATVAAAKRLIRHYQLPQWDLYYTDGAGAGGVERSIGRFILKSPQSRFVPSDFQANVWSCRGKTLQQITTLLEVFTTGDWLIPEKGYPVRAWTVHPELRQTINIDESRELGRLQRLQQLQDTIHNPDSPVSDFDRGDDFGC